MKHRAGHHPLQLILLKDLLRRRLKPR